MFYGCTNISRISIPNSVTAIDTYAFYGCAGLTRVSVPKSVTSIGNLAFAGCSNIETVYFTGTESEWNEISFNNGNNNLTNAEIVYNSVTESGICGDNLTWTLDSGTLTVTGQGDMTNWSYGVNVPWYSLRSYITDVVIENGVTSVGKKAFFDCVSLKSITIPNGVTNIGAAAFSDCSSLTGITIPDSVTSIGNYAFQYCASLTSITIPDSVTSIGVYAFHYCTSLKSITILGGVTSIDQGTFYNCTNETAPRCNLQTHRRAESIQESFLKNRFAISSFRVVQNTVNPNKRMYPGYFCYCT